MAVERQAGGTSLIDVLDRVLDKGIVIDAWVRVSLVGIDLITVEARVVVASIDTYLRYSDAIGGSSAAARPSRAALEDSDDDDDDGGNVPPTGAAPIPAPRPIAETRGRALPPRQRRPID